MGSGRTIERRKTTKTRKQSIKKKEIRKQLSPITLAVAAKITVVGS